MVRSSFSLERATGPASGRGHRDELLVSQQRQGFGSVGLEVAGLGIHAQGQRQQLAEVERRERSDLPDPEFYTGGPAERTGGRPDVRWRRADGGEMTPADWEGAEPRPFAFLLGAPPPLLVLLNPTPGPVDFTLPDEAAAGPGAWRVRLDTTDGTTDPPEDSFTLLPHHLVVLEREAGR